MTMSISSAPSSTANFVSASLVLRGYCPLGNPVATAAILMPVPCNSSFAHSHQHRIDANRRYVRKIGKGIVKMFGLAAKLSDFAVGVGSFQGRQVDHGEGQLQGVNFGGFLDAALLKSLDAFFDADLVDGGRSQKIRHG